MAIKGKMGGDVGTLDCWGWLSLLILFVRPLRLTLFEQYLFHEDRLGYPSRTTAEFRFSGTVDRGAFECAVAVVARRHPLTTAQVKRRWHGGRYWVFAAVPRIPVIWHEADRAALRPELRPLDVGQETAWEYHVVVDGEGWTVYSNQSHVICDGAGVYKVFHDLLLAYANEQGGQHALPENDVAALSQRTRYGLTWSKKLTLLPLQVVGFFYALGLMRRTVAPLAPSKREHRFEPLPAGAPHIVSRHLSPAEFTAFRRTAREGHTSFNNLCIAYFQTAMGQWRERFSEGAPTDWIRLSVPVNLRSKADARLPACNVISLVSIDRQAKGLLRRERLARRAKEDMDLIKRGWLSLTFLSLLWLYRRWPNGLRGMCRRDLCRSTAVLTNVGQIYAHSPLLGKSRKLQVRGAILERIESTAPIRPHMQVTLLLAIYAGEFCANLHYDPRALTREQAEVLVELFVGEIRSQAVESRIPMQSGT